MYRPENVPKGNKMEKHPDETLLQYAERLKARALASGNVKINVEPHSVTQARASIENAPIIKPTKPLLDGKSKGSGEREKEPPEVIQVLDGLGKPTGEFIQKDLF